MNRQVDVKALVSHVIRGDGVNKCRICMGDTSEGQVHLSDTVLMEGDKPVTLSELLQIVTGIQVPLGGDLPAGVCKECSTWAITAGNFRTMCRQTFSKWDTTVQLLCDLPTNWSEQGKIMFVIMNDNQTVVVVDENDLDLNTSSERLRTYFPQVELTLPMDTKGDNEKEGDVIHNSKRDNKEKSECKNVKPKTSLKIVKNKEKELKDVKIYSLETNIDMKKDSKHTVSNNNPTESEECIPKEVENEKLPARKIECPNCNKNFHHPLKLYNHLKGSIDMTRACYICGQIMARNELVSHLTKSHNMKVYECKKCPALHLTNKKYLQHLSNAHLRGASSCIDCGRTFQSYPALCAHTLVHRRKACPSCGKILHSQVCYLYHMKTCDLNKNRDMKKSTETKVVVKREYKKRNILVNLPGTDDIFVCDYCGKRFTKKKYVSAHMQIVHMKNTHAPCAYCGRQLATAHMTEHLKKHELNLSFTCSHCGIVLKTKLGYIQHLRLHTGERPYACKICKETFTASSRRSEHMRKVHKKTEVILRHACKLCPAKFQLPYRLKKHMKTAHINKNDDSLEFECTECNEKFGSQRGLLHHSRKHQKVDFPYKRPEKSVMLELRGRVTNVMK